MLLQVLEIRPSCDTLIPSSCMILKAMLEDSNAALKPMWLQQVIGGTRL